MTKNNSKPLVFFGTEDFSAQVLQILLENNFIFEAVITKPDSKKGRGKKLIPPAVKTLAEKHNIPVFQPQNSTEILEIVNNSQKFAGILVSFGKIIPESVINQFEFGIINLHPSLLPKYRGPSPIETAILDGAETGISVMSLIKKMDAGPVYFQSNPQSTSDKTASDLYYEFAQLGGQKLVEILPKIFDKSLQAKPQNENQASYCKMLDKSMSQLEPNQKTASELERQIRAFEIYPKSKYNFFGHDCIVLESFVSDQPTELSIKTKDGNFLNITKLKTPNGKTTSAKSFINGYKK